MGDVRPLRLRNETMTVLDLELGQRGTVSNMDALPTRLLEMGIVEGADIQMIKTAPLGDPILIKVRGCRLTIRKADAKMVEVSVTVRR